MVLCEVEHLDVTVRVASGDHRSATGAAPDSDRLLRAVVEIVRLRLVGDRAAALVAGVIERGGAADHSFARNAIDLLADWPHEVPTASRSDVIREPVRL